MTRYLLALTLASTAVAASLTFAPPQGGRIGHNLEAFTAIELVNPAAQAVTVTIKSNDSRLLFANRGDTAGTPALTLTVAPGRKNTDDFYIQAVGSPGLAVYSVDADGFEPAEGKIVIAPSAITIGGPSNSEAFKTTYRTPRKLRIQTSVLGDSNDPADIQPLAGGLSLKVHLNSSNPALGTTAVSELSLSGGMSLAATEFRPAGAAGVVAISPVPPVGFSVAANHKAVTITVDEPGLAITGDIYVGKDLETEGYVLLGEPAPPGGVDVQLTTDDGSRLILSPSQNEVGAKNITLHIPDGEGKAPYYLQGVGDNGEVTYSAVANGFRPRTVRVGLTTSGIMVVFAPYGPPDEGEVLTPMPRPLERPFSTSLKAKKSVWLSFWPAYLDPATHRGADITTQRLRPGVAAQINIKNSDPSVAKILSSITLDGKDVCAFAQFVPVKPGETVVSIDTPSGFSTPANATSVRAVVNE